MLGDWVCFSPSDNTVQVIVLDNADDEVWGGLAGVELAEEWRGQTLVPYAWLSARLRRKRQAKETKQG